MVGGKGEEGKEASKEARQRGKLRLSRPERRDGPIVGPRSSQRQTRSRAGPGRTRRNSAADDDWLAVLTSRVHDATDRRGLVSGVSGVNSERQQRRIDGVSLKGVSLPLRGRDMTLVISRAELLRRGPADKRGWAE